ncbi:hypothetical protein H5410_027140 [Solanum commersonii]|uniref:Uncharacterized protein n=1 Tax=Solanum commersonii TaxID=4109 RepID=A0A9J5Z0Y3_SOLCO|nr:hypothetical protein H5410_027140 [Solanum commersonii]
MQRHSKKGCRIGNNHYGGVQFLHQQNEIAMIKNEKERKTPENRELQWKILISKDSFICRSNS